VLWEFAGLLHTIPAQKTSWCQLLLHPYAYATEREKRNLGHNNSYLLAHTNYNKINVPVSGHAYNLQHATYIT